MLVTNDGKIDSPDRADAMVPPPWTESWTAVIAFSTTTLPAVRPVTSMASSIGTPAAVSDDSVRAQRASAIFWTIVPILAGALRRKRSHTRRPDFDDFHLRKPNTVPSEPKRKKYHWWRSAFETAIVCWVSDGILPLNCLNTPANTGMMKTSIATQTTSAIDVTTAGYTMADFT